MLCEGCLSQASPGRPHRGSRGRGGEAGGAGRPARAPRAVGRAGPGQVERAARDILRGRALVAMVGGSRFRPAIPAPVSRRQGGSEQAAAVTGAGGTANRPGLLAVGTGRQVSLVEIF